VELSLQAPDLFRRCKAHRQSPAPCLLRKRARSQGPLLHRRYPASTLERPCPTPAVAVTRGDVEAATLTLGGSPSLLEPPCVRAVPTTPADRNGCMCRLLPRPTRPSPNSGWVGIRIVLFEACSGFTRVTARMLAQPPKAAFVTGFRRSRLPGHAARQLPAQSTARWVEPSSTGDSRLRGAPERADVDGAILSLRFDA